MVKNYFDFYYDEKTKTMWVYIPITVRAFMSLKRRYKHVEVRQKEVEKRW